MNFSIVFSQAQLEKGIRVEFEHTNEDRSINAVKIATKIAKDHLREIPDYYDRLEYLYFSNYWEISERGRQKVFDDRSWRVFSQKITIPANLADQLRAGIEVEKEHTNNTDHARKIAMDHLRIFSDYYSRLAIIESPAFWPILKFGIPLSSHASQSDGALSREEVLAKRDRMYNLLEKQFLTQVQAQWELLSETEKNQVAAYIKRPTEPLKAQMQEIKTKYNLMLAPSDYPLAFDVMVIEFDSSLQQSVATNMAGRIKAELKSKFKKTRGNEIIRDFATRLAELEPKSEEPSQEYALWGAEKHFGGNITLKEKESIPLSPKKEPSAFIPIEQYHSSILGAFDDPTLSSSEKTKQRLGTFWKKEMLKEKGFQYLPEAKLWYIKAPFTEDLSQYGIVVDDVIFEVDYFYWMGDWPPHYSALRKMARINTILQKIGEFDGKEFHFALGPICLEYLKDRKKHMESLLSDNTLSADHPTAKYNERHKSEYQRVIDHLNKGIAYLEAKSAEVKMKDINEKKLCSECSQKESFDYVLDKDYYLPDDGNISDKEREGALNVIENHYNSLIEDLMDSVKGLSEEKSKGVQNVRRTLFQAKEALKDTLNIAGIKADVQFDLNEFKKKVDFVKYNIKAYQKEKKRNMTSYSNK